MKNCVLSSTPLTILRWVQNLSRVEMNALRAPLTGSAPVPLSSLSAFSKRGKNEKTGDGRTGGFRRLFDLLPLGRRQPDLDGFGARLFFLSAEESSRIWVARLALPVVFRRSSCTHSRSDSE